MDPGLVAGPTSRHADRDGRSGKWTDTRRPCSAGWIAAWAICPTWNQTIWHYGETALREYKSSAWYVARLKDEGFEVEAGTGGMPTAFRATWTNGAGPRIAAYAEYDAVPGNCQAAATRKMPRAGLSPHAGGHTDPHSALGISALGGALAAKAAMTELGLKGTIVFFGEPAEKLRLSKPVHAAKGYYDELDAAISFHPTYMLPLVNTARWDTHCGAGYACIYTFECAEPESWLSGDPNSPIPASHVAARAPGATDALFHMFGLTKQTQSNMLPFTQGWSLSEAILTAGQATADNLPAQIAEIQYLWRTPTIEMAEQVARVLDNNAEAAARAAHCTWKKTWVTKSRPGLPNHALAEATYRNIVLAGAPQWDGEAIRLAQEIQKELGLAPMDKPYLGDCETTIAANGGGDEAAPRSAAVAAQLDLGRLHRVLLALPDGAVLHRPADAEGAERLQLSGLGDECAGRPAPCIDPMIRTAAKTIGATITGPDRPTPSC